MNTSRNAPTRLAKDEIHNFTNLRGTPIGLLVREWLTQHHPSKIRFEPPFNTHLLHWEPQAKYVIVGSQTTSADGMALALAQQFASSGGHVVWVGVTADLHRISEQLMFKIAGLDLPPVGSRVQLDAVAQCKLKFAHEQIQKMWIDFCNVDDCGDGDVEQDFLKSVSSFKPTLIVVDKSIFDESTLNPLAALVRQTHAQHMIKELRDSNPMNSVLWHLSAENDGAIDTQTQEPSLGDLAEIVGSIKPDVVLLAYGNSKLAVAAI